MENHPLLDTILLDTVSYSSAEKWYDNILTQGHILPSKIQQKSTTVTMIDIIEPSNTEPITTQNTQHLQKPQYPQYPQKNRDTSVSFVDAFATNIDEMFSMYSYETKRDIRLYIRDKLIDWVAVHARKFFGPSTSRSISTCLRTRGINMDDLQRFAELVSFFLDQPIKAGNKVVVWHGFTSPLRDPICELVIKQQGVFVNQL